MLIPCRPVVSRTHRLHRRVIPFLRPVQCLSWTRLRSQRWRTRQLTSYTHWVRNRALQLQAFASHLRVHHLSLQTHADATCHACLYVLCITTGQTKETRVVRLIAKDASEQSITQLQQGNGLSVSSETQSRAPAETSWVGTPDLVTDAQVQAMEVLARLIL